MKEENDGMTIKEILSVANYRWLLFGQIVSDFGDSLTHLALLLLINRVTDGDTTAIAYLLIALAIPRATIGLLAGVFVDRWDRKRIMQYSDLSRGILVLALIFVATAENAQIGWIYIIAFVHSVMGTFFTPARSATIPNILPGKGLLAANSLSQISSVIFRVMGTAAAGLLVGQLDAFTMIYVIDSATFFISFLLISQLALAKREAPAGKIFSANPVGQITGQIREGLGIIFGSRVLVGTLVGAGVTMLGIGAMNVLMAPFIVNDLQVDESWFGAIELSQVIAMVLSGGLVAVLAARFKATNIVVVGLLGIGVTIALTSLVPNVWYLFPLLFAVGLFSTPINAAISTLFQTEVLDEHRGRAGSALGAMVEFATLISMFAAGVLAATVGVRNVFIISGGLTVLAAVGALLVFKGYEPAIPKETPEVFTAN